MVVVVVMACNPCPGVATPTYPEGILMPQVGEGVVEVDNVVAGEAFLSDQPRVFVVCTRGL